jgi:hypothetical protein
VRRDRSLDRPQAHRDPALARQILAHHVGIAAMPAQPFRQPVIEAVQRRRPIRHLRWCPAPGCNIPTHRHVAAPELARDPPDAPTQLLQPQHRRDLVRLPHHLTPIVFTIAVRLPLDGFHQDLLAQEGPGPHGATGPVSHGA